MKQAQTPPPDQDAMRPEDDGTGVLGVRGTHAAARREGIPNTIARASWGCAVPPPAPPQALTFGW